MSKSKVHVLDVAVHVAKSLPSPPTHILEYNIYENVGQLSSEVWGFLLQNVPGYLVRDGVLFKKTNHSFAELGLSVIQRAKPHKRQSR